MKTISATVVYPVYVQVEVPDDSTEEWIEEAVLLQADDYMQSSFSIKPVIQECEALGI